LILVLWLTAGCVEPGEGQLNPTLDAAATSAAMNAESIEVFFTEPTRQDAETFRGGLDLQIVDSIAAARLSVDVAIYDFNLWSIRDALIDAHQRGVRVRVVAESDNLDREEYSDLKNAGISVLGDRREGLMHNKFIVIDGQEVWSGSVNFTTTDLYLNNNNLLRVRSKMLAENYTREFEEMFLDDLFGDSVRADTPQPRLTIAGHSVENMFSPDDGVEQTILAHLAQAKESIHFLAFSFTSDAIASALLDRARQGIQVSGIMEEAQVNSNTGSEYERLRLGGVDVRLDGNRRNMHHKVIIVDGYTVITGSYNFTASAERRNDENVIIIQDPALAASYLSEYQEIYNLSQP
jgi:phosphatidylserine/phosphatidylglycerophosphate/cardiolipin synthase-like enzyme